jgi:succinoglycan biosynthesis protein ExoM
LTACERPRAPKNSQNGSITGSPIRARSVTVGILTYRRPDSLARTLNSLRTVVADDAASTWRLHDVLVVDNDRTPSARDTVARIARAGYPLPVRYVHEPAPGLAAARNRAIDEAGAEVLAFIDDDETAVADWPGGLLRTMHATGAALVGGPVRTSFEHRPPEWVTDGDFFGRPEPADGTPQNWLRSGNLAIDLGLVAAHGLRFDPRFGLTGGEDTDFSLRARQAGLGLQWSATAVVTEWVGPERTTLRWLTRRERRATANWVRAEVGQHPGAGRRVLVAARGTARLAQGAALVVAGTLGRRRAMAARGLLRASRGLGAFAGLAGGRAASYGDRA